MTDVLGGDVNKTDTIEPL